MIDTSTSDAFALQPHSTPSFTKLCLFSVTDHHIHIYYESTYRKECFNRLIANNLGLIQIKSHHDRQQMNNDVEEDVECYLKPLRCFRVFRSSILPLRSSNQTIAGAKIRVV
ncbi:hypothetical protein L1987_58996 [Smallanthus sonchifolius]|uniref:Uncharacterized protein n=1 Tax=Smallanthus sonchifolius TaxID=185202 RepID=A0ACB9D3Z9_9ASTR|nr:hypothetical protein L1987_58996 [Smallanthus sonchifolius]